MRVRAGGIARNVDVGLLASLTVLDSGYASNVVVSQFGHLNVYSNCSLSNVTLKKGGYLRGFWFGEDLYFDSMNGNLIKPYENMSIKGGTMTVTSGNFLTSGGVNSAVIHLSAGVYWEDLDVFNKGVAHVSNGATVEKAAASSKGILRVSGGGTVNAFWTSDFGEIHVLSSGVLSSALIGKDGTMTLSGGTALQTVISDGGQLKISGGSAETVNVKGGSALLGTGTINSMTLSGSGAQTEVLSRGTIARADIMGDAVMTVSSGGVLSKGTVTNLGILKIYDGSVLDTVVNFWGSMYVQGSGTVSNTMIANFGHVVLERANAAETIVYSGGSLTVSTLASATATTVNSGGCVILGSKGKMYDTTLKSGAVLSGSGGEFYGGLIVESGAVFLGRGQIVIDLNTRTENDEAAVTGYAFLPGSFSILVKASNSYAQSGRFRLAAMAGENDQSLRVEDEYLKEHLVSVNRATVINSKIFMPLLDEGTLDIAVFGKDEKVTHATSGILYWNGINAEKYKVEISRDNFETALTIETNNQRLNTRALNQSDFQWRVWDESTGTYLTGANVAVNDPEGPQLFQHEAEKYLGVFFARTDGVWENGYGVKHVGRKSGQGLATNEIVQLAGKNKITDIYEGKGGKTLLILTDDANGDALVLDDIYSDYPDAVAADRGRIYRISEIRAGAGDDIIDLSSVDFEFYSDQPPTIYGGDGNDVIWANAGKNTLYGDAGNDRLVGSSDNDQLIGGSGNDSMNGGGGDDTFYFGGNWGQDIVEQFASGKVTLHFESGSESNWDSNSLTYTDGENSVKVLGVGVDKITLKFGGDAPVAGAFLDSASEKIFDSTKGVIA